MNRIFNSGCIGESDREPYVQPSKGGVLRDKKTTKKQRYSREIRSKTSKRAIIVKDGKVYLREESEQ